METRNRRTLFHGIVVDMEQMEVRIGKKGWHLYQVVRHPGGVGVLPVHDDGTVTLIRQLRPAVGAALIEIPAGRLAPGEDPASCGRRELAEETGLAAETLSPLGVLHSSPGVFDEVIHLFLATGLSQGTADPEPYEEVEPVRLPVGEALRMAENGTITDGKTVTALLRFAGRNRATPCRTSPPGGNRHRERGDIALGSGGGDNRDRLRQALEELDNAESLLAATEGR